VSIVTGNQVGEKLRTARETAGLPKYRLAKLSGVGEAQIRQWERGTHEPTARNVAKLIPYIGGTLDYYFSDESPKA
jgi:transcriptional regulator with XRE-family HTH domain